MDEQRAHFVIESIIEAGDNSGERAPLYYRKALRLSIEQGFRDLRRVCVERLYGTWLTPGREADND